MALWAGKAERWACEGGSSGSMLVSTVCAPAPLVQAAWEVAVWYQRQIAANRVVSTSLHE